MPHMTPLGFMCPGLGKLIRSWVLSHCTINKPHDMLPLSYSPSPNQLPLLCTPLVFTTYHALYGTHTTASAPTIAFVLTSPVHTDKKGWTEYTPPYTSHFAPLLHAHTHTLPHARTFPHAHTLPCTHTCTSPPFAPLPVHMHSSFIRLYTAWFSTFSLI